ncbi:hypothetical protein Tcan_13541 [Toxocara canis]|uniref:Uncharacterized protein n=1 Tax=Toxocara canis TaxID=6265 RepID=A0A0B2VBV4_TOXCA|nr:hypothetical protein Tcan_13541 [Toxocara canis]
MIVCHDAQTVKPAYPENLEQSGHLTNRATSKSTLVADYDSNMSCALKKDYELLHAEKENADFEEEAAVIGWSDEDNGESAISDGDTFKSDEGEAHDFEERE